MPQLVNTPPILQCTPYLSPVVSGHTTHVIVYALPVPCSQWAHPHVIVYALPVPGSQWTRPPCYSVRLTCPRQLVDTPPMLQCTPYMSPVVSGHATHVVVYALPVPGSQWAHHPCCSVRLTCPRQLVGTPPILQCTPYLSPVVSGQTPYVIVYSLPFPCSQWAHHPCLVYALPVPGSQWTHHPCCSVGLTCHLQLVDTPPMLQCTPYLSPVVSGHTTHVVVYALPVPGSQWVHHLCCSVRLTCPRQLVGTPPMLQCTPYLTPLVSGHPPMLQCTPYLSPVVSGHTTHVVVQALPVPGSQWAHHPCCSVGLTCPRQLVGTPPMLQCTPYLSPVVSGHTTHVVVYALPDPVSQWTHPPCCSVRLTCPRQLVGTPPMLQCTPYLTPVVSGHTTHVVVYALPVPGSQWAHPP